MAHGEEFQHSPTREKHLKSVLSSDNISDHKSWKHTIGFFFNIPMPVGETLRAPGRVNLQCPCALLHSRCEVKWRSSENDNQAICSFRRREINCKGRGSPKKSSLGPAFQYVPHIRTVTTNVTWSDMSLKKPWLDLKLLDRPCSILASPHRRERQGHCTTMTLRRWLCLAQFSGMKTHMEWRKCQRKHLVSSCITEW